MKKKTAGNILQSVSAMLACIVSLPLIADSSYDLFESGLSLPVVLVLSLFFFLVHSYLAILIHEGGHCIAGLLTGYSFVSFRVGRIMFIRTENGIKRKKMHLQGTSGQCVMAPPDFRDGKIPVILYNLGGVLINLICAGISYLLYRLISSPLLRLFFGVSVLMELLICLTNGIPIAAGGVNNDGMNAIELSRNPRAVKAFWNQLKVNQLLAQNVRIKDMPEEWFELPDLEDMNNTLCASMAAIRCDRLRDTKDYSGLLELTDSLLESDNAIMQLHRNMLLCDRISAALLLGNRDHAQKMNDPELSRFLLSMKNYPTVIRTRYIYELLFNGNNARADVYRSSFETMSESFPFESELASEREMMADADAIYASSKA